MSNPAQNLRARKSNGAANGNGNGHTNGKTDGNGVQARLSNAYSKTVSANAMPTAYGQAMDKKLDEHQSYEFGGPVGVTAMMVGFPILMCK